MVKGFSGNPSMVEPTVVGQQVEWKPPLFTWVYSAFYVFLSKLPLSVEAQFRMPSAFFGAADVVLVYMIGNLLYGRKAGIAAALLFLTAPLTFFSSTLMMMESFSLFLALISIYFYLKGNLLPGSIFLGLLVFTKWLYALVPVIFIALYFIRDKRLPAILSSFLSIPLFLLARLLIAFYFGNFDNAIGNLVFDFWRPAPFFNPLWLFYGYVIVFLTLPMSWVFIWSLLSFKIDFRKELPIIAVSIIIFLLPFSAMFNFWYLIIVTPMLALFISTKIIKNDGDRLSDLMIISFMVVNLVFSIIFIPIFIPKSQDLPRIASFMEGKSVVFVEPYPFYIEWGAANQRYANSTESFILLEEFNTGILYYRFSAADDYSDLKAFFGQNASGLPCKDYIVVHEYPGLNVTIPSCFNQIWRTPDYSVYSAS